MRAWPTLLVLLFAATAAKAQALRPFCAERPGKATPPCILDAGHLQLEVGLANAAFRSGAGDVLAFGVTELRYGIASRLEAEASWAPWIVARPKTAAQVTGVGDLTLAARWSLSDPDAQDGLAAAVQGFVTAPTATHGFGAGGWTGGIRAPLSAPLPGGFSLAFAPELDVARNAAGHGAHLASSAALSFGRGFGDLSLNAELWGSIDDDPAARTYQASFDVNAALALGRNGQVDAGANFGLNARTPDVVVYIGVSHRF